MSTSPGILVVSTLLLLSGCASLNKVLSGERRPPPMAVPSPTLEAHEQGAINALQQFHRDYGVVTETSNILSVYFTQADWEMQKGGFGPGMRKAGVVFIVQDKDGCTWSQWTLAQKNLDADGWGIETLLPGPEDTDRVSCNVAARTAGSH